MKLRKIHLIMLGATAILTIVVAGLKTQTNLAANRIESEMATQQVKGNAAEYLAKSEAIQMGNTVIGAVLVVLISLAAFSFVMLIINEIKMHREPKPEPEAPTSPDKTSPQ